MRKTFTNLTSIVGGEIAIRVANFAAAVVIARLYGPTIFGLYATTLAFASIVGTIGDNGLSISTVSEVSRRLHETDRIVSSLYITKTLLFAITVALAAIIVSFFHLGRAGWIIGAFVLAKVLANSYAQLHFGILKSLDQMRTIGIVQILHACALLCGIAVVFIRHSDIVVLLLVLLSGQLLEFLISGLIVYLKKIRFVQVHPSECWQLVAFSTPIGGACVLSSIILRMDVLAIALLFSASQVGHFAAANNGLIIIYLVGSLFGNVLLPEMVKTSPSCLEEYLTRWRRIIYSATIPVSLGAALIATPLVGLVYGESFHDAGKLAAVMALALPFIILNYLYFNRAIALKHHRSYLFVYVRTALLAIILDFTFAYTIGPIGVAAAIVIREALMFAMYVTSARAVALRQAIGSSTVSMS
jgi:O-antigen/teichoic acid export membrane protein